MYIFDIPEGQVVEDTPVGETPVVGTNSVTSVTQIGHAEVAAGEISVLADVLAESNIPIAEGTFSQDPAEDASMEDMADTYDSYHAVLASDGGHGAGTQASDLEVIALTTIDKSPTKIGD